MAKTHPENLTNFLCEFNMCTTWPISYICLIDYSILNQVYKTLTSSHKMCIQKNNVYWVF